MKSKKEIQTRLFEIGEKIDRLYKEYSNGNMITKDRNELLHILQVREDVLEWVLENDSNNN